MSTLPKTFARLHWVITACCFSTSFPSSSATSLEVLRQPLDDGWRRHGRKCNARWCDAVDFRNLAFQRVASKAAKVVAAEGTFS